MTISVCSVSCIVHFGAKLMKCNLTNTMWRHCGPSCVLAIEIDQTSAITRLTADYLVSDLEVVR